MAKKKKTIAALVNDAADLMQKLVRLKARDDLGYVRCVTCGVVKQWNDGMQGGHYIERAWLSTKLLEDNIHPQCASCNGGLGGKPKGNLRAYTLYMIDTYGRDFVEELEAMKHTTKKYVRYEVEDIIKELREQIRGLE